MACIKPITTTVPKSSKRSVRPLAYDCIQWSPHPVPPRYISHALTITCCRIYWNTLLPTCELNYLARPRITDEHIDWCGRGARQECSSRRTRLARVSTGAFAGSGSPAASRELQALASCWRSTVHRSSPFRSCSLASARSTSARLRAATACFRAASRRSPSRRLASRAFCKRANCPCMRQRCSLSRPATSTRAACQTQARCCCNMLAMKPISTTWPHLPSRLLMVPTRQAAREGTEVHYARLHIAWEPGINH